MARLRKRKSNKPRRQDPVEALDFARAFCWYGLLAVESPPWDRDEIEAMGPAELRKVLAACPRLPAEVLEGIEVAEGRRRGTYLWERHTEQREGGAT